MSTAKKLSKHAVKRSASGSPIDMEQTSVFHVTTDWSDGLDFISPNNIPTNAIGRLFCLTTKYLINRSFTTLYRRSLEITWTELLNRERRSLKSNDISLKKCFILNRLITECTKDPYRFAQDTGELYEEIQMKMSSELPGSWTAGDFFSGVQTLQRLQCQRRLFYMTPNETNQAANLLMLQQMATILYFQFLYSYQVNGTVENETALKQLLQQSFVIVTQPSIPECAAATKYEKSGSNYTAKLLARMICLLDLETIGRSISLSPVGVKLYPLDRQLDEFGEDQQALVWMKRSIVDANVSVKDFSYVEVQSIELKKVDAKNARPLCSAKLCQLQFQWTITINDLNIEENLTVLSQSFGLCSHAQYYPEFVAQVLLRELSLSTDDLIPPDTLANYVNRYQTRVSGVEVKPHTSQYIRNVLQTAYGTIYGQQIDYEMFSERKKNLDRITSLSIYGDILTKLISQMEMFIDHPFLSMMYHDGLFYGICDNAIDHQLYGTRDQPQILLRFNSLLTHQATQHAFVRFIVHNGQLIRATFHTKAFVDEMCHIICEVNRYRANRIQTQNETLATSANGFSLYFHEQLFRLNTAASPMNDTYQPLIPVLWKIMRTDTETPPCRAVDQSNVTATNTETKELSDVFVQQLVHKLSDLLVRSSYVNHSPNTTSESSASRLLAALTDEEEKELLSNLLHACFHSKCSVDVATQVINKHVSRRE